MGKILVAYFSATGGTKKVATKIAEAARAELFEIKPEIAYTSDDLNWVNKQSRCTLEMNDASVRPAIMQSVEEMSSYDIVILGFPIWWYKAPRIINTFLEAYNFENKHIILFATSGGSGFGDIVDDLKPLVSDKANISGEKIFNKAKDKEIKDWVDEVLA